MFGITLFGNEIKRIVIDSRSAEKGDLFVAYHGEKTDGNDYVQSALDRGASAALCERFEGDGPVIITDDVQGRLEDLIADFRDALEIPIVGISGSVGKTTTKEMISCVLERKFRVLKTEGNLNNTIGVPMTMSRIQPEHEVAVVEMGINHFGEMTHLARMVRPTIMVYTNIGHAHLEFLGDRAGVFKAKTEVLDICSPQIVANAEDDYLRTLDAVFYDGSNPICPPPAYGKHIVFAMNAATAVGRLLGMSEEEIREGLADFQVVGRRGTVTSGKITVIDDCYNANLDSMIFAIDSMMELPGERHVAVLGQILELGDQTEQTLRTIGDYARSKGCLVFQVDADYGAEEYSVDKIRPGDVVLVKASHGAHLESIADALKEMANE